MPAVLEQPVTMTQVEHFDRCYRALGAKFGGNVDKRTRAALEQYRREHPDDELEQIAAEKFPDSEYVTVRDVPIFAEHTTTDSRGNKVKYGKAELAGIVRRCNERILDTGDFAPLSDGHTPTQEMMQSGAKMPDVLGYDGPFRLGIIGRKKPRYAIFADEHYHKSDVDKVRRLPRRSPEVWLEDRLEDRILDPIAALGAETPRLDLGMVRFRRGGDDREVERYSALPSGTNTFIPSHGDGKTRYDAASSGEPSMDANQTVNASVQDIVGAIQATKQWQALDQVIEMLPQLQQLVAGSSADPSVDPAADPNAPADPGMPPTEDAPAAAPTPDATPAQTPAPVAAPAPAMPDETGDMDDQEKQQYGALCPNGKAGYMAARKRWKASAAPSAPSREAYSRLATERDTAAAQAKEATERQAALTKQVEELKRKNRDTERYSKLSELSRVFAFDLDEEFADVAELDQAGWERHERAIHRYAKRDDLATADYLPTDPPQRTPPKQQTDADKERYYRRAGEIANDRQRRGEHITAQDALAEAMKEQAA